MQPAMIGMGDICLVPNVWFSGFAHDVVCVDKVPGKAIMPERAEESMQRSSPGAHPRGRKDFGLSLDARDGYEGATRHRY